VKLSKHQLAIKPGDQVVYARRFLRSICDYSHARASRTGKVLRIINDSEFGYPMVELEWEDERPGTVSMIAQSNIWPKGKRHLEPA
jgi:hypothetical protein